MYVSEVEGATVLDLGTGGGLELQRPLLAGEVELSPGGGCGDHLLRITGEEQLAAGEALQLQSSNLSGAIVLVDMQLSTGLRLQGGEAIEISEGDDGEVGMVAVVDGPKGGLSGDPERLLRGVGGALDPVEVVDVEVHLILRAGTEHHLEACGGGDVCGTVVEGDGLVRLLTGLLRLCSGQSGEQGEGDK